MKTEKYKLPEWPEGLDLIFLLLLVVCVPLALFLEIKHAPPVWVFLTSAGAIVPLAKYISQSTEELAAYISSARAGLINATFGNVVELSLGAFSLHAGLVDMVKASLVGAIIGNVLLVLGMAIYFGGRRKRLQEFNQLAATTDSSTLLLATSAFVLPAVTAGHLSAGGAESASLAIAAILVIAYLSSLRFSLGGRQDLCSGEGARRPAEWSRSRAVLTLLAATITVAAMSEVLVGAIEPMAESYGLTELFLGMFFIAIIGNAAEHVTAITQAMSDHMEGALAIAVGSSTQVAMFVVPVLVFMSYFFAKPMDLIFTTFQLVCLGFATMVLKFIVGDGKSHWYEGVVMLAAYGIMAVLAYFYR